MFQYPSYLFKAYMIDNPSIVHTKRMISFRFVHHFFQSKRIVSRAQTGKLIFSTNTQELIHREVSFHLWNYNDNLVLGTWLKIIFLMRTKHIYYFTFTIVRISSFMARRI